MDSFNASAEALKAAADELTDELEKVSSSEDIRTGRPCHRARAAQRAGVHPLRLTPRDTDPLVSSP
jgi:hypothetical protein